MTTTYVYDDAWTEERARLAGLEAGLDAGTQRLLMDLGLDVGWSCLEVGAGGGSMARWLCDQVGETGRVVASDQQTTLLQALAHPTLEVLTHDIVADPLPEAEFDLVHVRWMLHWLAAPAEALTKMVSALRPGGLLVAEEPDFVTLTQTAPAPVGAVSTAVLNRLSELSGTMNPRYGARLYADMAGLGVVEIGAEGRTGVLRGGEGPWTSWWRRSVAKVREPVLAAGTATAAEFDEAISMLAAPDFATTSPLTIAVWGRRANC